MPWSETCTMDLRIQFINDWLKTHDVAATCRRAGVSRKTGYKWIDRFRNGGERALADASRRPQSCPHATPDDVSEALVALRRQHPTFGAKKLVAILERDRPELALPATSTASNILDRAGLVRRRTHRRRLPSTGGPWPRGDTPNAIWCIDYKGWFRTRDGTPCYPLTLMDECSRYMLAVRGFTGIDRAEVKACLTDVFRERGLPQAMRSDNGAPFASTGICRLSSLSVWLLRLSIQLRRNKPAHPQDNGCLERMHRDLKAETTRPPGGDLRDQQTRFDEFVRYRNVERPHESLGQRTPSSTYAASPRPFPERLPPPEYPSHYEKRFVRPNGCISLWGEDIFIGKALDGENVGLVEQREDRWTIYLGALAVGVIDRRTNSVLDPED